VSKQAVRDGEKKASQHITTQRVGKKGAERGELRKTSAKKYVGNALKWARKPS